MELRLLTEADEASSTLMSHHAFGSPTGGQVAFTIGPHIRRWGLFDGKVLAAKANDRSYDSWIGGRRVPTAGVAGVAVAPEYRGGGLARRVMTHLLDQARQRGAVISTLFRTAPALYRSLGFEQVAELTDAAFPAAALRGIRAAHTTVRRATGADAAAVHAVYAAVAAEGSGLLSRDGDSFSGADPIAATDGCTVAEADGRVVGYVSWNRGTGYSGTAALTVVDLLSTTADGYRALLSVVGSFDAVTPTIRIRTSGTDPIHWFIPGTGFSVEQVRPYMLRVVDVAGAVAARGWPTGLTADVPLSLDDPVCPWNSGSYRLVVDGGQARLESVEPDDEACVVTPSGLAVLYAGGVPAATLRRGGLLAAGTRAGDAVLDAAFAGPRPAVLDYF
ncbi:Predicted acetyltransferase [Nakamurella panacisegetis]|uniref:Predicted acetyltransferase n=1 Tax=Nakamurella panacisegetis TaxID=1090615 RepID=A0A1H0RQU1_9ACTN|nr:GNAT family N-acetyltransferase [Nakamurella panacisegetis]SDP31882.1 Predicted acetyltransferase [Nakamurella panacisegetis]